MITINDDNASGSGFHVTVGNDGLGKVKYEGNVDLSKLPRCKCKGRTHGIFMLGAQCPRCSAVVELPPEATPEPKPIPEFSTQSKENKMNDQQNNPEGQDQQPINPLLDFPVGSGDQDLSFNFLGKPEPAARFGRYSHNLGRSFDNSPYQRISQALPDPAVIMEKANEIRQSTMNVEMFFAQYMVDISNVAPLDGSAKRSEVESDTIVKIQFALRNVREFVIAQMMYRNQMTMGGEDPFFAYHAIPILIPVRRNGFEAAHEMTLTEYVHKVGNHYRDFQKHTLNMAHLSCFGAMIKVAMINGDTTHYVVIPEPEEFITKMIEFESKPQQPFRAF